MTGMCALPQEELSGHWNAATLTHTHTHRQVKKKKKKDAFSLSNTVQNLIHANTLVVTEYGATPASAPAPVLVLIVNSSQGTDKHKYFLYLLTRINTDTVFE